jgi:glycosyltransferase involved in cell wall biosynthesis
MLQGYDIGLLPMPNLPIWTISSPLKRSEYLSSGLLVLGIDHLGHHLPTMEDNTEWFRLFEQQSFVDDAVLQIQKWLKDHRFSELSSAARQYAESYLDWNVTVQPLLELLNNLEE